MVSGMGKSITDIIFDFDVLVDVHPRLPLEGQYPPGVIDMVLDPADRFGFGYYQRKADLGWSESQVLADYERQHGPAVAWVLRVFLERQEMSLAGVTSGMGELLRDLDAAGVRLWGLADSTTRFVDAARERFGDLRLLRDVMVSAEEGMVKPDPRIFRRAVSRFGVEPRTTLFVGCRRDVEASGRAAGVMGIEFADEPQLRECCVRAGVLC